MPTLMKMHLCNHEYKTGSNTKRLENALEKIKALHLRLTGPRKEIISILAAATQPLSSDDIFNELKKGSSDLVTVYRSLTTLEEAGLLQQHDLGDGIRRYELTQEGHHHHYVQCRSCGKVEAFVGCDFESTLLNVLAKKGYSMIQHSLNVHALCSACQN